MNSLRRSGAALMVAAALFPAAAARADSLPAPQGEVILTVSGAITNTNDDGVARLDMALLDGLPRNSFATSTIWTEGVDTYEGVLLTDLLDALGATGTNVLAKALNDYEITFPVADVTDEGPLLAYRTNGKPMSIREKGPIWMIFPYDDVEAFRTEQTYARSIWQLDRIVVKP
ncbi:MAG: molybdopterin-dependent oxidoreductase [Rhodobacter sp.]|nr:molybdopterin-dependent oxidoreductase [Rhodobacter sp.]MCA3519305.1 molybdopterin-dependent oxidoreductase [Rhodobacter sp.]MCA3522663.1 molybdopterin-dependent oxidoreductase [Rhodobacter sp.]MCA3525591.1 molybdopterin-dependent oxidoreductase [Rhodobacter sp.]MCA3528676.1 molybdopterin-dependent oxidoreductase [Rhodobacter sp.]